MLYNRFQKLTPAPAIPGDRSFPERLRASAADSGSVARDTMDYLRGFREVEITTADGQTMTVMARNVSSSGASSASRPYWHCLYTGRDGANKGAVNVARGLIEYLSYTAGEDRMDHAHNTVEEADVEGLEDGHIIYCLVEVGFSQLTGVGNDGTNLPVWTYAHFEFRASNTITKFATPAGSPNGIYDQFSSPAGTRDADSMGYQSFYFPIAIYHETDGVGSVEQLRIGAPIFIPFLSSYHSYPP